MKDGDGAFILHTDMQVVLGCVRTSSRSLTVVSGAVYHIILCARLLISAVLTQCMLCVLAAITVALLRVNDNCYVSSSPSFLANGLKIAQVLSTRFVCNPHFPFPLPFYLKDNHASDLIREIQNFTKLLSLPWIIQFFFYFILTPL